MNSRWIGGTVLVATALLFALACGVNVTNAQIGVKIIRVDGVSGADSSTCGAESAPCKSLQRGVNNAGQYNGATVLVAEGTYTFVSSVFNSCEANLPNGTSVLCVFNRQIVLQGGYPHGNWTQADPVNHPTIIDGQGQRRVIYAFTDPNLYAGSLRLVDVILQNGVAQGATLGTVDQMTGFGGGLLADYARVELIRVTFRNNQARGGNTVQDIGGSAGGGGAALRTIAAGAYLENVTFTNNQALAGSGSQRGGFGIGGGLFTYQTTVNGNYITATNNQSVGGDTTGVGLYAGETGDAQGAGIALQISTNADLQNVIVMTNTATGGDAPNGTAGGAFGAGIFAEQATVSLHNLVTRNNTGQGGSGLNPSSTQFRGSLAMGGGLMTDKCSVVIDHAQIIANQALGGSAPSTGYGGAGSGGGIEFTSGANDVKPVSITNSVIADNYAAMGSGSTSSSMQAGGGGGGIGFWNIQPTVHFTTIARNRLNSTAMQGLALAGNPQNGDFDNNIIADHTFPANMHAVYVVSPGNVILNHTLWAGNSINVKTGGDAGSTTNWNPVNAATADFVSPGAPNYNYHIKKTSPAKNAAVGDYPSNDVDNQSRPWLNATDIGADEYMPIVLSGGPVSSGKLLLKWWTDTSLVPGVAAYEISLSCPPQAACPGPINAGNVSQYTIGGLTNGKTYTVLVTAKDGSNQALEVSNAASMMPTDKFVYLPMVVR